MIAQMLKKIILEYQPARNERFKNHPLQKYINNDVKKIVSKALGDSNSFYKVDASPGKGRWAFNTWITIMHPQVTKTAQSGYYPVYLFSDDSKTILFSLGQGYTKVKEKYGTKLAKQLFTARASTLRSKIPEASNFFQTNLDSITLRENDPVKERWVDSSAFGKAYNLNNFPSEKIIIEDLNNMIMLYEKLVDLNGWYLEDEIVVDVEVEESKLKAKEKKVLIKHKQQEAKILRNTSFINIIKKNSNYCCEACGINCKKVYGQTKQYIEAHHIVPVSQYNLEIGDSREITKDDISLLCPNCHRMIHMHGVPSLDEFKNKILPNFKKMIKNINK